MVFPKFNTIARGGSLPTKRLIDLTKGQWYMVTNLKEVTTKYGKKLSLTWRLFYKMMMISTSNSWTQRISTNYLLYITGVGVEFSGK